MRTSFWKSIYYVTQNDDEKNAAYSIEIKSKNLNNSIAYHKYVDFIILLDCSEIVHANVYSIQQKKERKLYV